MLMEIHVVDFFCFYDSSKEHVSNGRRSNANIVVDALDTYWILLDQCRRRKVLKILFTGAFAEPVILVTCIKATRLTQ